jgi:integrase
LNGRLLIGEPKSRSGFRSVRIPQIAIDALKEQEARQEEKGFADCVYAFTDTKGNPIRVQNMVRRSFKPILKKAGLPDIRFHDLRHTHATLLLQQGVNPKLVQERLGHATISLTLDTYSHVLPNMQKQVVKELDALFG